MGVEAWRAKWTQGGPAEAQGALPDLVGEARTAESTRNILRDRAAKAGAQNSLDF